jgi:hypothetical protein
VCREKEFEKTKPILRRADFNKCSNSNGLWLILAVLGGEKTKPIQSQSAAFGCKYDISGFVAGRLLPRFIRKKEWTGVGVTI